MEFKKELELTDSEDEISRQKRKSLLMVDFDCSPLEPRQICEAEEQPGTNIEKLLLERVMLRKELRLRSVQESLLETSHKLEVERTKLGEYESLPGFRQFLAFSRMMKYALEAGGSGAGLIRSSARATWAALYQLVVIFLSVPSSLFYLLPASLQMLSASLVATLASWLGETAENVTNECRERTEQVAGELARKNKNSRRRRRS